MKNKIHKSYNNKDLVRKNQKFHPGSKNYTKEFKSQMRLHNPYSRKITEFLEKDI